MTETRDNGNRRRRQSHRMPAGKILLTLMAVILPILGLTGLARASQATMSAWSGDGPNPLVLVVVVAGFVAMAVAVTVMFRKAFRTQSRIDDPDATELPY
ncbi:MAG: hypothetical protein KDJ77_14015 [Rhodobiaceae bacterium]|nr:hypothetical protein [Rhodobiaceae bacterium]